jgi:transcriptional regulator with GAF, ATPase, and Fis domain
MNERRWFKEHGIKSGVAIPLKSGKAVLGAVSFASIRDERDWPDELIRRFQVIANIFSNALTRKRADENIQEAFTEIKRLKDRLEQENLYLREEIQLQHRHEEIVGKSDAIKQLLNRAEQVAETESTVLISGETGTGKELLARAIHRMSPRKDRPMITVNCTTIPGPLMESEMFGCEKGAFTGALSRRTGRFEVADGSTVFLDEVGELPMALQMKLLRVLEQGEFERLGSNKTMKVDVRFIAATNRDLAMSAQNGSFRRDLYYRLSVFPINIPPLHERVEDIELLTWAFVGQLAEKMGKKIERIPKKSMEALKRYPWPGNVRELRNVIEQSMITSKGKTLVLRDPEGSKASDLQDVTLESVERRHILKILGQAGWRVRGKNGAAERLGLHEATLRSRMKKLGIQRPGSQA